MADPIEVELLNNFALQPANSEPALNKTEGKLYCLRHVSCRLPNLEGGSR